MAIIRTAAEAKTALPRVLSNLGNDKLIPDMESAEYKWLVPVTGFDLYDDFNTKVNTDPPADLNEDETALLKKMRTVVCIGAYLDDLGTDSAKITDSGLRSTESANMPRVVGWQYKELKNSLQSKLFDAIEALLKFLFEKKDSFNLWTDCDEYKSLNGLLIKTGQDFDAHYKLFQPLRTFYSLKNLIDEVQTDLIKPAIGEELLQWLMDIIAPDDDQKNIIKLLKKSIAYMTIKKACQHYSVRFDSNGFTVLSQNGDPENSETAGRTETNLPLFEMKMKACEEDSITYLTKARKALLDLREQSSNDDFNTAYDDGPLKDYDGSATRVRGNDIRTGIFRF